MYKGTARSRIFAELYIEVWGVSPYKRNVDKRKIFV